jgi:hypothetical protein
MCRRRWQRTAREAFVASRAGSCDAADDFWYGTGFGRSNLGRLHGDEAWESPRSHDLDLHLVVVRHIGPHLDIHEIQANVEQRCESLRRGR